MGSEWGARSRSMCPGCSSDSWAGALRMRFLYWTVFDPGRKKKTVIFFLSDKFILFSLRAFPPPLHAEFGSLVCGCSRNTCLEIWELSYFLGVLGTCALVHSRHCDLPHWRTDCGTCDAKGFAVCSQDALDDYLAWRRLWRHLLALTVIIFDVFLRLPVLLPSSFVYPLTEFRFAGRHVAPSARS